MPQFEVRLFQHARVHTETFTVEADNEAAAKAKVEAEDLANKDLTDPNVDTEAYELEAIEIVPEVASHPLDATVASLTSPIEPTEPE